MRHIELKKELDKKTPYETILQFGCGPNFVLNRWNSFEQMIKDQGITFWFRFWFTFCFNPGCTDLKAVQNQWPELINKVFIAIHSRFLQEKEILFRQTDNKSFVELLQECTSFGFGAALCVIFYKWLVAKEMDSKNQVYWTIPKRYLERFYKPNALEEYIVYQWNENLASLFGINERRLHWVKKLLHGNKDVETAKKDSNIARYNLGVFIEKIADVMRLNKHNCKMEIELVDEQPAKTKLSQEKKKNLDNSSSNEENATTKSSTSSKTKETCTIKSRPKRRICFYCNTVEGIQSKFKRCKRCAAESWLEPRYYCSDACQIEHWFKEHHNEHFEFVRNRAKHSQRKL